MLLFNLNYEAKKCLLHQGRFKHLNLVAEYSDVTDEEGVRGSTAANKAEQKIVSLGAILFF